jgi:hypothetical protein
MAISATAGHSTPRSCRNYWSDGVVPNNGNETTFSVTLPTDVYPNLIDLDMSPTIDSLTLNSFTQLTAPLNTVTQGLSLTVIGDLVNNGGNLLFGSQNQLTAAHYIQNSGIFGTSNSVIVADAVINSGTFSLESAGFGRGTMNGNLEETGGYVTLADDGATVNGNVTVDGGTFATIGKINRLNGNLKMTASSTWQKVIASDVTALPVSGDVELSGTAYLTFSGRYHDGERIPILTYQDETGQLDNVFLSGLLQQQTATLDYGPTELDAVIVGNGVVPEPTSLLLMSTGILVLARAFFRRSAA